jgi:pentose-5-phosphate-3-epimerase
MVVPRLKPIICPSLLSCDLARLAEDAAQMIEMGADWLHMVRTLGSFE